MKTLKFDDYTVTFDDSEEAKQKVFDLLFQWYKDMEMFSAECIGQSDETYITAPDLLGEIAEEGFKFEVEWEE
jgi:hypothetical protein